jgi:hypothetical protein
MALSRVSYPRRVAPGGAAKPFRLASAAAAVAAALLAGCGGDASDPPSATAVAGESYATAVSKPLAGSVEAGVATPAQLDSVPVLSGKVRYGVPVAAAPGVGAPLSGALPFPAGDAWNRDVIASPADPASAALVAAIGANASLKAGFGALAGVPYAVVDRGQPRVPVTVAGDATPRSWPIPASMPASADPSSRMSVVDRDAGVLYELHGATPTAEGGWNATAIAAWRLDLADAAPIDAAGTLEGGAMPVFAGLVRHDEVAAGAIRHALRIVVPALRAAWVAPARGPAAGADDPSLPPAGARLRLKADVAIPPEASPEARAILQALKTYGAVVVGVGPALTLEGAPDAAWDAARIAADLARIRGADFEVVALGAIATP